MNPVRLLATRRVVKPAADQTRDGKSSKSTNLLHLHMRTLVSAQLLHPVISKTAPNAGKHRPSSRPDAGGRCVDVRTQQADIACSSGY